MEIPQVGASCSACSTGHGSAHTVTIKAWQRFIHYTCETCQQSWIDGDDVALVDRFALRESAHD